MSLRDALSPQSTLPTLAGGDVLFNTLARIDASSIDSAVDLAAGSTAASVVLRELSGYEARFALLATLFQWALIGYVVYEFSPRIYPDGFGELPTERSFRAMTVAVSLAYLSILEAVVAAPILATMGVTTLLFGSYLVRYQDVPLQRQLATESGVVYDILSTLIPDSEEEDGESIEDSVAAGGLKGGLARVSVVVVVGAVLSVICAMFSLLGASISRFYPLVEVSIFGWVAYQSLEGRISRLPAAGAAVVELEDVFYESVAPAFTRVPIKGMATVLLLGLGLSVAGIGFQFGGALATTVVGSGLFVPPPTVDDLIRGLLAVGVPIYSVSAILFWFQVARRVPAHFDYYRTRRASDELTEPRDPPVARPPGWLLPPTGLVAVPLVLALLVDGGTVGIGVLVAGVFLWCLALAGTVFSVWRARAGDPQPPASETSAVPVAYALQVPLVFYFTDVDPTANAAGGAPATSLSANAYVIAALVVMGVVFFFFEDGMQFLRHGRGMRKLLPHGLVLVGLGVAFPLLESTLAVAFAGALFVFVVAWGIATVR
ncbi:MAG: hypothetical protein ABEK02_04420 [Haloquadratum sp.]